MTSMTIVVTGAAGFIGSHLCEKLCLEGHEVIGIDNFDPFYDPAIKENNINSIKQTSLSSDGKFDMYRTDINDTDKLINLLKDRKVEAFIHLAAKAGVRPSIIDPKGYSITNIDGTISVLEICKHLSIKKLIFASSSSVYGNNKKVPFSETDNVDYPISPYAATKKAGELICHTYSHLYGIETAALRFFTVYGPRQRPDLAIHKFARLLIEGETIPMYGDGSTRRDYTYIDDILDGITKTLNWLMKPSDSVRYEIFNLGESQTIELKELISRMEDATGKKANIERLPMQPGDVNITYADISKAKDILGYNPTTPIAVGLEKFAQWFKEMYVPVQS